MHEEFVPNDSEFPSAEVSTEVFTAPVSSQEFVKVMVVGSRKGIDIIVKRLHHLRFAEVSEWSPPTPYGDSGEVMRLVRKKVALK